MRVERLDQSDFLGAAPAFDFLFAANGGAGGRVRLEPDEFSAVVFSGEARDEFLFVLVGALRKVAGDGQIESAGPASHEIDMEGTRHGGLVGGGGEGLDDGGEFEDFDLGRAVGPVVAPADDDVAAGERVAVRAEVAALKFKLDVNALPLLGADLALGFAVGESGLDGFDDVAEFFGDESEKEDDAEFVDRLVAQAAEVERTAVGWAAF